MSPAPSMWAISYSCGSRTSTTTSAGLRCHSSRSSCAVISAPSYDGAEITAHELRDEWQRNPALVVVDVREPHEYEIAHIDGAGLMPLGELPDRLGGLAGAAGGLERCPPGARA